MSVLELLNSSEVTLDEVEAYFNGLDSAERVVQARTLGPRAQRQLWTLAEGTELSLEYFVPENAERLDSVRHYGRNTLPVFKMFEKRFCRPPEGQDSLGLWGYNEGSTRPLVGPGYFVCRYTDGDPRGSVVIDYTLEPDGKCDEWPAFKPNGSGLSRFVYHGMQDFMRRVSEHVTIGRAYIKGRESNNYFVLCRESQYDS